MPLGSEPFWPRWVTGTGTGPAQQAVIADNFYKYMAFSPPAGPTFKITDYDFDKDPARLGYASSIINVATFDPITGEMEFGDFNAFRQGGGKLIIWHGWADADVTPQPTVSFYEALAKKSGGISATQEFARLFMVPSMDHCGIQTNGPAIADTGMAPLTALEHWVEEGKAPTELIATKTTPNGNQTLWRRPICAYPKAAHYKGSGDPTDPTSFACEGPRTFSRNWPLWVTSGLPDRVSGTSGAPRIAADLLHCQVGRVGPQAVVRQLSMAPRSTA